MPTRICSILIAVFAHMYGVILAEDNIVITTGNVPEAIEPPLIDGNGNDIAWHSANNSAHLPINGKPSNAITYRLTRNNYNLFCLATINLNTLTTKTETKSDNTSFRLHFNPNTASERRLTININGKIVEEFFNGWEWKTNHYSDAAAAAKITNGIATLEISFPRNSLSHKVMCHDYILTIKVALLQNDNIVAASNDNRLALGASIIPLSLTKTTDGFKVRISNESGAPKNISARPLFPVTTAELHQNATTLALPLGVSTFTIKAPSNHFFENETQIIWLEIKDKSTTSLWPLLITSTNKHPSSRSTPSNINNKSDIKYSPLFDLFAFPYSLDSLAKKLLPNDDKDFFKKAYYIARATAAAREPFRRATTLYTLTPKLDLQNRYRQWIAFIKNSSSQDRIPVNTIDIRGRRLYSLALILNKLKDSDKTLYRQCITEYITTRNMVFTQAVSEYGHTYFDPLIPLYILAADCKTELIPRTAAYYASLLNLSFIIAKSNLHRNSTPLLPGTSELEAAKAVIEIIRMAKADGILYSLAFAKDFSAPFTAGLIHLSRHAPYDCALPQFSSCTPRTNIKDVQLFSNLKQFNISELNRFTPEGQVAVPLTKSAPDKTATQNFDGLQTMRDRKNLISANLFLPPSLPGAHNRPERIFGATALNFGDIRILDFPTKKHKAWTAPLTVNHQYAYPASLPMCGKPLPTKWLTSSRLDLCFFTFDIFPHINPNQQIKRTVFMKKGTKPLFFICDFIKDIPETYGVSTQNHLLRSDAKDKFSLSLSPQTGAQLLTDKSNTQNEILSLTQNITNGRAIIWSSFQPQQPNERKKHSGFIANSTKELFRNAGSDAFIIENNAPSLSTYLILNNSNKPFSANKTVTVNLTGFFAAVEYDSSGMSSIALSETRSFSIKRRAKWSIESDIPIDAIIYAKQDGSYVLSLENAPHAAKVTIRMTPFGNGNDKSAIINAMPSSRTVFRLL